MFCPRCGAHNPDNAKACYSCGDKWAAIVEIAPPSVAPNVLPPHMRQGGSYAVQHSQLEDSAGMRMLLPVGRSGWAIAAGYLGLLSPLAIFAPFAVVISLVAIFDLKNNPTKRGWGRAIFGMIMGVIFSLALVFIIIAIVTKK